MKTLLNSILYFFAGLTLTLLLFIGAFQLGKGIYSGVQLYMSKDYFVEVNAEVVAVESYVPVYCDEDKDYKVTLVYHYADETYHWIQDLRILPKQMMGELISITINPRQPAVIKEKLEERIYASVVIALLMLAIIMILRSKNRSSYLRVSSLTPKKVLSSILRKNQKDIRRMICGMMILVLAGAMVWVNKSERIS